MIGRFGGVTDGDDESDAAGSCPRRPTPPTSTRSRWPLQSLRTLLRKAAARTYDDLWKAVGTVCNLFSQDECLNSFIAAGYEPDWQ